MGAVTFQSILRLNVVEIVLPKYIFKKINFMYNNNLFHIPLQQFKGLFIQVFSELCQH